MRTDGFGKTVYPLCIGGPQDGERHMYPPSGYLELPITFAGSQTMFRYYHDVPVLSLLNRLEDGYRRLG